MVQACASFWEEGKEQIAWLSRFEASLSVDLACACCRHSFAKAITWTAVEAFAPNSRQVRAFLCSEHPAKYRKVALQPGIPAQCLNLGSVPLSWGHAI